jgi:hypothetical protein
MNAHTDMSSVIIPRSDQYNADDLVAGPITVRIREVKITPGSEQPVSILIEDSEKVFRPCSRDGVGTGRQQVRWPLVDLVP